MSLSDITEISVHAAIAELDEMGRDAFFPPLRLMDQRAHGPKPTLRSASRRANPVSRSRLDVPAMSRRISISAQARLVAILRHHEQKSFETFSCDPRRQPRRVP